MGVELTYGETFRGSGERVRNFAIRVTGPSRSLSLKLSETRVYEPQIRARLGTTAHICKVVAVKSGERVSNFSIRRGAHRQAPP